MASKNQTLEKRISDLVLKARSKRKKVSLEEAREIHALAIEGTNSGVLSSAWAHMDCISPEQFWAQLNSPFRNSREGLIELLTTHTSEQSVFSQSLRHTHSSDRPPLATFGPYSPDLWGYIHVEPGERRWFPDPINYPEPGVSWTELKFSWIYASTAAGRSDATNVRTELTARFSTEIEVKSLGLVCIEISSRAARIGFGHFSLVSPTTGSFVANHGLCVSLDPKCVASPWDRSQYSSAREAWRVTIVPAADPMEGVSQAGGIEQEEWGGPITGVYAEDSLVRVVATVNGPGKVQIVEYVRYIVDLTGGIVMCPIQLVYAAQSWRGLYGHFEPLSWRVRRPC